MGGSAKVPRHPLGRIANSIFFIWLFFSGFFWTLITLGITGVFLTNLLFSNFFGEGAEVAAEAQARFREQQAAGMGGMGGTRRQGRHGRHEAWEAWGHGG